MTTFRRRILLNFLEFFDLGVVAVAFCLATLAVYGQADSISLIDFLAMRIKIHNFIFVTLFFLGGHISYAAFGLYQSRRLSRRSSEILDILKATALGSAALWISALIFHLILIRPLFIAVFFTTTTSILILSRLTFRCVLGRVRCRGRNLRYLLIVGTNPRAISFAREVESRPELGYRIIGFVDNQWSGTAEFHQNGYVLVADFAGFQNYIRHNVVDEVAIDLPIKSHYLIASNIISQCEEQGIIVRYLPNLFTPRMARSLSRDLGDESTIMLYSGIMDSWALVAKRVLDISFSLILILLLSPLFLIVALLIKFTSPGPILFVQERVGLNKRRFNLYKFRTMTYNAEKMQSQLESLNEMKGPVFKIRSDPRITMLGRLLRKYSVDELPQLLNVLKGEMSLVGPRPLPLRDYIGFEQDSQRRRFSVRPGLTCLWQINGRSNVSFDRWMELDMQYIDGWSLLLDFKILAKTIPAVISGHGAH
jgi:exopolysaccharide biosynthesis polyprenyl glycosylphosphotransferase